MKYYKQAQVSCVQVLKLNRYWEILIYLAKWNTWDKLNNIVSQDYGEFHNSAKQDKDAFFNNLPKLISK